MCGRKTWSLAAAVLLLAAVCVVVVVAECPNGCSGNGDCMARDKCDCYKNYQGNDCADRTCLFGRAHIDTPKGDINMDKDVKSAGWILKGSQQDPEETWEYFNPSAIASEAHFYMECSNKGICDRATGLCQCFDGYEGNGCQRTTCPGKCNDHGTCESIRELASKNGGTLFGREGSAGAVNYDLWDANSTYGCRCDPWFFGPDCNKRNCKVGVDPLYLAAGKPRYETFIILAYADADTDLDDDKMWIRLRVFDYYGESYITKKIVILDENDADNIPKNLKAVTDAIKGVPNLTFAKIKCETYGVGSDLLHFMTVVDAAKFGTVIVCQYTDNPGKMRIPEIADKSSVVTQSHVVTTSMQGEDEDWFTKKTKILVSSINIGGAAKTATTSTATGTAAPSTEFDAAAPRLAKIGPHIVLVTTFSGAAMTLAYPLRHTIPTDEPVFVTEAADDLDITATSVGAVAVVGEDFVKFATGTTLGWNPGDLIFYHNAFYYVQRVWSDSNGVYAQFDKPFGGDADTGADGVVGDLLYKIEPADTLKPYQYVSECSGRGMCGYETGVCTCFKGYTNDNCNRQNILAL